LLPGAQPIIVLSHWPHVATQVEQQVAELVAEHVFAMYFNGTVHTSNLLLDQLCPRMLLEPFTLETLMSNKFRRIFDTVSFNQSENGIPNDVTAATGL